MPWGSLCTDPLITWDFLDMQILRQQPTPSGSETPQRRPACLVLQTSQLILMPLKQGSPGHVGLSICCRPEQSSAEKWPVWSLAPRLGAAVFPEERGSSPGLSGIAGQWKLPSSWSGVLISSPAPGASMPPENRTAGEDKIFPMRETLPTHLKVVVKPSIWLLGRGCWLPSRTTWVQFPRPMVQKNQLSQVVLWQPHTCHDMHVFQQHTQTK